MATDHAGFGPRIPDSAMPELLELIKGADSIELKLTIPAEAQRATIASLAMDPVEAQPRQVFFFDTPDLLLYRSGVVVRARRIQGGRGDTVVKLRPVVPSQLPGALRRSPNFNVEVDALPGGFVCSGSMKGKTTNQAIRDAVSGKLPLKQLFTKEQRTLFKERAPAGITFESLVPLGPTYVLKGAWIPASSRRRVVAEMWLYQDGSRIFELSTKCLPAETFQVAAEARAALAKRGVAISDVQQTKTKTALEFFAAEAAAKLAADAAAQAAEAAPDQAAAPAPDAAEQAPKAARPRRAPARPGAPKPAPSKAAAKPAPTKAASPKAAPEKPAPTKAAATKAAPTKAAPGKAASTKAAPPKAAPAKPPATRRVRASDATGTRAPRR